ncbi:MAG: NAD-dependent epimerase/dehydratase family protein [Candidatus Magnetominusculus sp. LBB02]|nr:NAD-dependent epimerase/dehydratase family protein [Candidatus Magnetominusculus sp. LBB02]
MSHHIIVTGGAGFIGSHLAEALLDRGSHVTIFDNLHTGKEVNIPRGADFINIDLGVESLYSSIKGIDCDAVFHLAGQSSGEASFDDPEYDFRSHVASTFYMLRWAQEHGVSRFLYSSSMSVYGDPDTLPAAEGHPLKPKTFYAAGKAAAEAYINLYSRLGVNTTVFRLFSVYGARQNLDNMMQGMLSIYLSYMLAGDPIIVKGSPARFRDFTHIKDVVNAWLSAYENPVSYGKTYNLASGDKTTVEQLLNELKSAFNQPDYPIEFAQNTAGDQFGVVGDISLLKKELNFKPSVNLKDGISEMVAWARGSVKRSADTMHHDIAGENILVQPSERFVQYRKQWEENPKTLTVGNFPIHLDIETTSTCNLRCPFCKTTYSRSEIKNGFMAWDTLKKIMDEAGEYGLYACKFNFRGEPLLHKDLCRFIKYAKEKGLVDVFFNTNGTLLTPDKARALIESGLDRLTVSFEGFEKELYEKNRVGATFENVVKNIEALRDLKIQLGSKTPKVRIQAVLIPELQGRLDEFIAFWKDKADQVSYNEMLDNVPNMIKPGQSPWICPFPYQRLMIMWDGTITACYNDHYGKLAVGNVNSVSIKEAWQELMEPLRILHREGRAHEAAACAECPTRMNEIIKRGEA